MSVLEAMSFRKTTLISKGCNLNEAFKKNDIIFDIDLQGTKQLSKFENLNLKGAKLIRPLKLII